MCYSVLIEQDLKNLEFHFDAKADHDAFERFQSLSKQDPKKFRPIEDNARIYPYYFAPVVVMKRGRPVIVPMRYRLRPAGSMEEVPNQYNLYNARLDGLTTRQNWKKLFMQKHGLIAFRGFYEWVLNQQSQRKKVVYFHPTNSKLMTAPVLYDIWQSPDGSQAYASFAIITGEPPKEVLAAGHDRCPIPLAKENWIDWLNPEGKAAKALLQALYDSQAAIKLKVEDAAP